VETETYTSSMSYVTNPVAPSVKNLRSYASQSKYRPPGGTRGREIVGCRSRHNRKLNKNGRSIGAFMRRGHTIKMVEFQGMTGYK